jgi:predicted transcriptional regulator
MKRPITIAIDDDMVQVLDLLATTEERSRSQVVGRALKAWFARHPSLPALHGNDDATPPEAA